MDWVGLALLNAFIFGLVSIIDSHLVSRRMPSVGTYFSPVGFTSMLCCLAVVLIEPFTVGLPWHVLVLAVVACTIRVGGNLAMMIALQKAEVSRVMPVIFTYPVFVAIMAVSLLGEKLDYLQWLAIVLVVAGAVMISFRGRQSGTAASVKLFAFLIGISLTIAVTDTISKYVLNYISFWNLFTINTGVLSVGAFIIAGSSRAYSQLRTMKNAAVAICISVLGQALAMAGLMVQLQAIQKGPVSLVTTIFSSRPIFVLIIALVLSRAYPVFLEWQKGARILALRIMATVMIFAGIAVIYLT